MKNACFFNKPDNYIVESKNFVAEKKNSI